jgi:tetratricopeptide (TPR) repeat protein
MRLCNPCDQDNDGYTAAHYAVERDDIEMLKALTTRFYSEIKLFSEQQIKATHERCLNALSIKQNQGLTVFMLACHHQSIKCLNYLLELNINDVNLLVCFSFDKFLIKKNFFFLQDRFGDTCLHYAVVHRNEILVNILITQCNADVNGGDHIRPSILDIVQFNREQKKPFDRKIDDSIEQTILSHKALNRCQIRRITNKRKDSNDNDESMIANLACISVDPQTEIARNYARLALASENNGDIDTSLENYQRAMNSISNNTLDWTDYALKAAIIHMTRGENQLALDLLEQALSIRNRFEKETDEINQIQRAIDNVPKQISIGNE